MIPLKSDYDLQMLRKSGSILSKVMKRLKGVVSPGITTGEIDRLAEELIIKEDSKAAFKGYRGFPAATCISVNEEVVHGIPGDRKIQSGDIVSLDLGVNYKGYFSDAAITLPVGKVGPKLKKLIQVSEKALCKAIKEARIGNNISDISYCIQNFVEKNGFSVVRQFVGHGIGLELHEEPEIPNFGLPHKGPRIEKGMVLAIETMVNSGTWECEILENSWTAVTKDKQPSAHFEHTIAITDSGPRILTN